MHPVKPSLRLRQLDIDTYNDAVIYMRNDCNVCRSEGFEVHARVEVTLGDRSLIATIQLIGSDILEHGEASLSIYAWKLLAAKEGDEIQVTHAHPVSSLGFVRSKIYNHNLESEHLEAIVEDIVSGRYSDIQISAFLTACAGGRLSTSEIIKLTQAMVEAGDRLSWPYDRVVDKHSVGGLPGNRTTPIVVPIVTAFGLMMPKTSSRAITSPAGTADTMEVLAPVELDVPSMRKVVSQEGGCIVWGGSVSLSPADDILIRVEKALDLDSEGQLIASVLSKKIAAGSTHVVIDMPVGPTAKVRHPEAADGLKQAMEQVAKVLSLDIKVVFTDGIQPVGRGIGPALEAKDVVSVLQCAPDAPQDLRERALLLAGQILEFSPRVEAGHGAQLAQEILDSGKAWQKFQAICEAQGGMREIPEAAYSHPYIAKHSGMITAIDNRRIALIAKLAGAPRDKMAGISLQARTGDPVEAGQPLFIIHAESKGELEYALAYLEEGNEVIHVR